MYIWLCLLKIQGYLTSPKNAANSPNAMIVFHHQVSSQNLTAEFSTQLLETSLAQVVKASEALFDNPLLVVLLQNLARKTNNEKTGWS